MRNMHFRDKFVENYLNGGRILCKLAVKWENIALPMKVLCFMN